MKVYIKLKKQLVWKTFNPVLIANEILFYKCVRNIIFHIDY